MEPMTKYGYDKLISELKNLKEVERPKTLLKLTLQESTGI